MPDLSAFRLLTGVVALIAVACGASSTAPAEAPESVAQPSARPESTPTWVPPTRQRLAPDPLFDPTPTPRLAPLPTLSGVGGTFVEVALPAWSNRTRITRTN